MTRGLLGLLCALLLGGCGKGEAPAAASVPADMPVIQPVAPAPETTTSAARPADAMARYDGYGDLRLGMDEAAFERAWAGELEGTKQPGANCFYRRPKWVRTPSDLAFMFEGGRFVRYEVGTAKEVAPGGGKVGMSAAQIRALYGARLGELPHKYDPGATILRVTAPAGAGVLVFETDAQGRVARWRVGLPPQVDYVEGCA